MVFICPNIVERKRCQQCDTCQLIKEEEEDREDREIKSYARLINFNMDNKKSPYNTDGCFDQMWRSIEDFSLSLNSLY